MRKYLFAAMLAWVATGVFAMVNINTASQSELEKIKGVGATKAKAIVEYRAKNGPFKATSDVMKVHGIKMGTYNKIKNELAVAGATASTPSKKTSK